MFIEPMLLEKADQPFNDENYIAEWKQDGWRMLVVKWNGTLKLLSRHKNEFTHVFKEFLDIDIPDNSIIDCELIAVDEEGKCDFEALQNEYRSKIRQYPLQLVAFDLLYLNGKDLRRLPLFERKQLLIDNIKETNKLVISRCFDGLNAVDLFELIKQHKLEGIVMKVKDSIYESRRSFNWLKILNLENELCYISGVRKGSFGVYLSYLDGTYAGMIEFMKPDDRKKVYKIANQLKISESDKQIYIEKKVIIDVSFRNKYKSGLLRIPKLNKWISNEFGE